MFFLVDQPTSPETDLAKDEALVDVMDATLASEISDEQPEFSASENLMPAEVLRLWEFSQVVAVMGRSSRISEEINVQACEQDQIPYLRRSSGGASIVAGPGCLMYTLLIDYRSRPAWRMLDVAHQQVMNGLSVAVQSTLDAFAMDRKVDWQGTCDLTIDGRKFSGNALRCRRHFMIYHGTILLHMPLDHISRYLLQPPRQPEYRNDRDHGDFVCNLLPDDFSHQAEFKQQLIAELATAWQANESWAEFPFRYQWHARTEELLQRKYLSPNWHRERL
ncbi:lipoate--protein ligase family protein [Pirellulaceae bacterium SH449]